MRRRLLLALSALPAWRMAEAVAMGAAMGVDFAPVRPGQSLVFPADHGAHPDFRTEWWYATGWLSLPDGSPLGFQTTFFRVRTGVARGGGGGRGFRAGASWAAPGFSGRSRRPSGFPH